MLHYYLACDRYNEFKLGGEPDRKPSLLKELEARGYDITTIRFSIQKRKQT